MRDYQLERDDAIRAAQTAAGYEFLGTLNRLCLLPALGSVNTTDSVPAYVRDPSTVPPRAAWYADAAQVFDNLYFVGGKLHSAWVLQTSAGYILLDTIYPYNSEELILGGMQRLGLNPREIRYAVISHAHGDHIGGAELVQELGAQVVLDPTDWDTIARYPNRYTGMSPHRDIDASDGMKLSLGDTTVTLWQTPGHTPGTLSYTFTVFDHGRPLNVVYSGGTAFNFPCNTPDPGIRNMQVYIDSQRHIAAQAAVINASVLLSNHSEFDNAVNKIRMLAGRGAGAHPFDIGADMVQRYFELTASAARAVQIGLEGMAEVGAPSRS
jgi:metallo-beta-lactamase class B